jgi:hypothetical protein
MKARFSSRFRRSEPEILNYFLSRGSPRLFELRNQPKTRDFSGCEAVFAHPTRLLSDSNRQ